MNVFVTGGAGYIGSICVEEMLNAGPKKEPGTPPPGDGTTPNKDKDGPK